MLYIGIDLGGTTISGVVTDDCGSAISRACAATPPSHEPQRVADAICALCFELTKSAGCEMRDIAAAGVGSPGICDPNTGVVEYCCNLDFHRVPLAALLEQSLGIPVFLENDANAAALGEYAAGCGRGSSSLVAVTIGTGIGGGVILGGKILSGYNFSGGELGHFVMVKDGESCACGRRGCFEQYASATALVRMTRLAMAGARDSAMWTLAASPEQVNGKTAFDAMRLGDEAASRVIDEYIGNLACGLTSIVNILQPEILCLSGGVASEGEALLAPLRKLIEKEDYARSLKRRVTLCAPKLGADAGAIGAAMLPKFRGV